jgi:hypothetical protein
MSVEGRIIRVVLANTRFDLIKSLPNFGGIENLI